MLLEVSMPIENPFRPGAGQKPLYLAGREVETNSFKRCIQQKPVLRNLIISGLRGVGKTVLLESFKPIAVSEKWIWIGNDMSESASLTEEKVCKRLIADIAAQIGPLIQIDESNRGIGFGKKDETISRNLSFNDLWNLFEITPGLNSDKLKSVLQIVRDFLSGRGFSGLIFSYDEAQNLSDHSKKDEYPLSLLLDVFSSMQKDHKSVQIILILTGLPTLFPKLNEVRTYTERMFEILMLKQLNKESSTLAIEKPIEISNSSLVFSPNTVENICDMSGGYPYFIQYICREVFDAWIGKIDVGEVPSANLEGIISKLDQDFFSARWENATDRQQEFMSVVSQLENPDVYFSIQDIVTKSNEVLEKGFSSSHSNQIINALIEKGLIYRQKHGKYGFAVPLMAQFIRRQNV